MRAGHVPLRARTPRRPSLKGALGRGDSMNKTRTDPLPDFVGGSFVDTSRPDGLINDAIEALAQAFDETRRMSRVARIEVLDRTARALEGGGGLPRVLAVGRKGPRAA